MNIFSELQTFDFGEAYYRYYGNYGPIRQRDIQLSLMIKGTGQVVIDGISRVMPEGEISFAFVEESIEYMYPADEEHHVLWCRTGAPVLSDIAVRRLKKLPFNLKVTNRFNTLMKMGLELDYKGDANQFALRNSVGQTLFFEFFNEAKLVEEDKSMSEPIKRAIKYIENNIGNDCQLKILAEISGVSAPYLSKLFQKHMGVSPSQYVWQVRLERSVNMLLNSSIPMTVIAEQCGFKNQQHFSRYVKERYGCSPKQLREESHH